MAARRARNEIIRCPYCGEDYASSYKHCPFCDELPMDEGTYEEEAPAPVRAQGGKRLMNSGGSGGRPSPGRVIGTVISLALIVAAAVIVITQIVPKFTRNSSQSDISSSPTPSVSSSPTPEQSSTPVSPTPEQTDAPTPGQTEDTTPPTAEPTPPVSEAPVQVTFSLSESEFTISNRYPDPVPLRVTFSPSGSSGAITWSSSNPSAVQVNQQGVVSAGTRQGSATITAALENGYSRTCLVHNVTSGSGGGSGSESGSNDGGSSGELFLNRADFTLEPGEFFQMVLTGTSSTPTWSIGDTSVATVSGNGTVTYVGSGRTTLTCTVDGQTLTCIVRCS